MKGILLIALLWGAQNWARGETSFWVWNRSHPLSETETTILQESGIRNLYWHVGSLTDAKGNLKRPPDSDQVRMVPVVRIEARSRLFEGTATWPEVAALIQRFVRATKPLEIQLDYDCPTRLLSHYAKALNDLRHAIGPARLSVTALASWIHAEDFRDLERSVDALFPMFYDLYPDKPADVVAGRFVEMADSTSLIRWLRAWRQCRISWHAGLPNFSRVTIFDSEGRSRGHCRQWRWDELLTNKHLDAVSMSEGLTILRPKDSTVVSSVHLEASDQLVVRYPDRKTLASAKTWAHEAGAQGVIWFQWPDGRAADGWSARQLAHLGDERDSQLELSMANHRLVLRNEGPIDLAPNLNQGYRLELVSEEPIYEEAGQGSFASFSSDKPLPLATRISWTFAHLPAGATIETAYTDLKKGTNLNVLRWRLDAGAWKHLTNNERNP